jgi:hypothetical protein
MDILIVFRARSETMNFAMLLRSYKISCQVVNTPRVINVSCGVSVKTSIAYLEQIDNILQRRKFSSYGGVYQIEQQGVRSKVIKLR